MRNKISQLLIAVSALSMLLCWVAPVSAQTYPSRPVRIIIPLSSGGTTDVPGRIVAQRLENNPSKYIILAAETATISMAHVLRLQYGFDVQLIGKKQRPNAKPGALSDTYNPITGGTPQTIYFNGFDEGIDLSFERQVKQ